MNRQKIFILITVLALIGVTAGLLQRMGGGEKLGLPGVKTRPLPGTGNLEVLLPEQVAGFTSQAMEVSATVRDYLPKDTSFGQRVYQTADGAWIQMYVVLMGTDRTSIHKPQVCLPSQGLTIDRTEVTPILIEKPKPYDLPVVKLTLGNLTVKGRETPLHGLFIYWFVTDGELSADSSGLHRMWRSTLHLMRTGVMQRWAYVSCFTVCEPGQEEAAYSRVKALIAATVPQFQLATGEPVELPPAQ